MNASDIMTRKLLTIDSESTLSEALAKMVENGIHTLPVVHGKKYAGMLSYREILRRRSVNPKSKVLNFSVQTPGISESTGVMEVAREIRDSGLYAVPVLKKGILTGIISRTDLLKNIREITNIPSMPCRDIMTREPVSINVRDSTDQAMEKFRLLDEGEMPVTDESGVLLGILRAEDISRELLPSKERIKYGQFSTRKGKVKLDVSSLMYDPVSADLYDDVLDAVDRMVKSKLHVIPVTKDKNILQGVIENVDIIDLIVGSTGADGLLVNVSGLEPGDEDLYDITFAMADKFTQRFSRFNEGKGGTLNIHVIKYKNAGNVKYSIRTRLISGDISMSVDSYNWNYGKCLSEIFEDYERRIKKEKERA
ncbi:MAG: CBS domain-containing protein [Candidatus Thermoplasmatota archaeon]|nr:CBS domain-containing protein [Candidatus Thermoplasmatota archaeon]